MGGAADGDRVLAGLAAVTVTFGTIHGITLGFGLTLIGEAVDYAVYVQVQRQREDNTYLWRGLWLAALTSSAGFVAMMLSGFAGLMQLGLMSIVGIAVAASVARFCLPDVLQPLDASRLARFAPLARFSMQAPRLRAALLLLGAASVMLLVAEIACGMISWPRFRRWRADRASSMRDCAARPGSAICASCSQSTARRRRRQSLALKRCTIGYQPKVAWRDRWIRFARHPGAERGDATSAARRVA